MSLPSNNVCAGIISLVLASIGLIIFISLFITCILQDPLNPAINENQKQKIVYVIEYKDGTVRETEADDCTYSPRHDQFKFFNKVGMRWDAAGAVPAKEVKGVYPKIGSNSY